MHKFRKLENFAYILLYQLYNVPHVVPIHCLKSIHHYIQNVICVFCQVYFNIIPGSIVVEGTFRTCMATPTFCTCMYSYSQQNRNTDLSLEITINDKSSTTVSYCDDLLYQRDLGS